MSEKKFSMGRRSESAVEFGTDQGQPQGADDHSRAGGPTEEPIDRVNFELPRSLRLRFNQEAARRDMKKRDLVREIFEYYFADQ